MFKIPEKKDYNEKADISNQEAVYTWTDIPIYARASQLEKDLGRPGTATKNYKNLEWCTTEPKTG
ncbi:MAG: hypothetical protein JW732_10185 [Dehalococcoidia bacterium]|nr:hypothetical protein [Dehalococcoidia bacterium]